MREKDKAFSQPVSTTLVKETVIQEVTPAPLNMNDLVEPVKNLTEPPTTTETSTEEAKAIPVLEQQVQNIAEPSTKIDTITAPSETSAEEAKTITAPSETNAEVVKLPKKRRRPRKQDIKDATDTSASPKGEVSVEMEKSSIELPKKRSRLRKRDIEDAERLAEEETWLTYTKEHNDDEIKKTLESTYFSALSKIKDQIKTLHVPEIQQYKYYEPYPETEKWCKLREQVCESPIWWKELTDILNTLGGAVLVEDRRLAVKLLEAKPTNELTEEERKSLRYAKQRNPIRRLFPTSYADGRDKNHFRLYPNNELNKKSGIVGLKGIYRENIINKLNNHWLPEGFRVVTLDLKACHTGIFVGLAGERIAPFTTKAYQSNRFWDVCIETALSSGIKIEKEYLKRIFYKALNGGSVDTPESIVKSLLFYYSSKMSQEDALTMARDMIKVPAIKELGRFQRTLAERKYVYLTFTDEPFRGGFQPGFQSSDPKDHPSRSSYHGGLITSRVLVTVEQVIVMSLYVKLLELGSIPLCLEHDGIVILTNSPDTLKQCRNHVLHISKDLVGVEIDLESKDKTIEMS
jgi:hypothetical protein